MSKLTDDITALAINYMGPASGRFLQRQTSFHMKGLDFNNVERKDLPELARWIFVSGSLLINTEKAKELSDKIAAL